MRKARPSVHGGSLKNTLTVSLSLYYSGNASTLSDGAAATVLMTEEALKKYGGTPLARIIGKIMIKYQI